jgi:hypothetical protein
MRAPLAPYTYVAPSSKHACNTAFAPVDGAVNRPVILATVT